MATANAAVAGGTNPFPGRNPMNPEHLINRRDSAVHPFIPFARDRRSKNWQSTATVLRSPDLGGCVTKVGQAPTKWRPSAHRHQLRNRMSSDEEAPTAPRREIKSIPPTVRYEPGKIVAGEDAGFVRMTHA